VIGLAKFAEANMSVPAPTERVLRFGTFELDIRVGELRKRGEKLRLQGQPLQVLAILLMRAGDLVTRAELRVEIWTADTFVDFDHSLHNAIARLREVLGDSAETPRYIETLPRCGYRFIARVDEVKPKELMPTAGHSYQFDARGIQSIAVLPLGNLSGDPGHDYFADGMTEALITSLAKIKALRVISRTSAMQYKGAPQSLPQIARELSVDVVIEGSVSRSGERVRITAQLIHAASDHHVWAESYERDFRDILSLQSEIARQVANQVRIIVTPEERARLGSARQINPEAHDWYLRARYYWNKRTEESVKKGLSYFHRAIDSDPTYAQGYAGLADSYNILGYDNALPPTEAYPKGKAAALQALELDDSLAEPHATLGVIKRDFEWDWSGAEEEFQKAIELNPGCVEAYHWRRTLLSMLGRHAEALREKNRALAVDLLSVVINRSGAHVLLRSGLRSVARALSICAGDGPEFRFRTPLAGACVPTEKPVQEAIAELETGVLLSGNSTLALAKLGHGYAMAGRCDEAHTALSS
jgi:TolB-like protein